MGMSSSFSRCYVPFSRFLMKLSIYEWVDALLGDAATWVMEIWRHLDFYINYVTLQMDITCVAQDAVVRRQIKCSSKCCNQATSVYTVMCYLRSQPIQRFVAGQQLRKHATNIGDVARQPPPCNNGSTVGSGVFYVVRPEAISCQW
jgi:hypothetical protein